MSIITIDFESYYDSIYSLKKLSTEAYVRSPLYETIGVSIAVGLEPARWYTGANIKPALGAIDWHRHALLAYNTAFDGAILAWHYGHYPALYLDAMGMARCCGVAFNGARLGAVCEVFGVGTKGDYIAKVAGKHADAFTPDELAAYGEYCINDNHCAREIYKKLKPSFPMSEVRVQDRMLRMFIDPVLRFDEPTLQKYYQETLEEKRKALENVAKILGIEYEEKTIKTTIMSNPQFAGILQHLGIEPPTKISPRTGRETYAFAKTDPQFVELLEDENPSVSSLVACRLGVKSTIEETRALRFLDISKRGNWPVQYNFWGAGVRFSGGGQANPQNLRRGGTLRDSVLPPPGHALVVGDLSQIECRMTNYVAGQTDVINTFRQHDAGLGPDVYCTFAGKVYGHVVTPEDKQKRMVGKVGELSLGYGGSGKAYKRMLFNQAGIIVTLDEAGSVVAVYRATHQQVQKLWYCGDDVLEALCRGLTFTFGKWGCLDGSRPEEGVGLPNGTYIRLPELRKEMKENGQRVYTYSHWEKNKKVRKEIYGAKLVALCMQGLARIVMTDAMLRISERQPARLMTHDELVFAVPLAEVEPFKNFVHKEMTRMLMWAPDFPLACEVGSGLTYGGAK